MLSNSCHMLSNNCHMLFNDYNIVICCVSFICCSKLDNICIAIYFSDILFCLSTRVCICLQVQGPLWECPRAGCFQASLFLHTTCVSFWCNWSASCVVAYVVDQVLTIRLVQWLKGLRHPKSKNDVVEKGSEYILAHTGPRELDGRPKGGAWVGVIPADFSGDCDTE